MFIVRFSQKYRNVMKDIRYNDVDGDDDDDEDDDGSCNIK